MPLKYVMNSAKERDRIVSKPFSWPMYNCEPISRRTHFAAVANMKLIIIIKLCTG